MPHQPHETSPLFSAGSNDHGTDHGNLTELIELACKFAQNHPASVGLLETLLLKCLDFHESRHPSMTPSIRLLSDFLIDAMKLSAPSEALSPGVNDHKNVSSHSNTNMSSKKSSSLRIDGWTQEDEAKLTHLKGLEDYKTTRDRVLRSSLLEEIVELERQKATWKKFGKKFVSSHGLRGTLGTTSYLLSPGIVHELSNGIERMSVNENDFKAVCVAAISVSRQKLNPSSSSSQLAIDTMRGSSEFSVKEISDQIQNTPEAIIQPTKMYVSIRLLRTFGFIERPRLDDKRVYVPKWPESWDIWNVEPEEAVDIFWERHLKLNSKPRLDGLSVKVAKNRFLRGKISAVEYVQHMSNYELSARIASFSGKNYVTGYTEDGPTISLTHDEKVNALFNLLQSDQSPVSTGPFLSVLQIDPRKKTRISLPHQTLQDQGCLATGRSK